MMQRENDTSGASSCHAADQAYPNHIAIIMDGNGRWAKARHQPRIFGHRKGVEALRNTIEACIARKIQILTLYAFSSENWSRPEEEVSDLLGLLKFFVNRDLAELHKKNVRVRVIGGRDNLKSDILNLLQESEELTKNNSGLTVVLAFNYGSRQEITRAVQEISQKIQDGFLTKEQITDELISKTLDTKNLPDPDLIIRTSGEQRLSNFLLWQAAYAEFVFTPVLWPDFNEETLDEALQDYMNRERRFGGRLDTKAAK